MVCENCQSKNEVEDSTGHVICLDCNIVKRQNNFVSSLEFTNNCVTGSFGTMTGNYTSIKCLNTTNYSEKRLYLAKRLIEKIAVGLQIPKNISRGAEMLFKMAVEKNWIQGRNTDIVVASCLYLMCRQNSYPLLQIDFSDKQQENIYKIARTYLNLCRLLHFTVPNIDPCQFIHRFCAKMDLGNKENDVANTGLRIIKSMKRDWMAFGRKPTGLVAAAILIASRYHSIRFPISDMVPIMGVCVETIKRRILEFKQTKAASLTLDEFAKIDLIKDIQFESNPPSFKPEIKPVVFDSKTVIEEIRTKISEENLHKLSLVKQESDLANTDQINEIDTLSAISETEMDSYLQSNNEVEYKTIIWNKLPDNIEWEKQQMLKKAKEVSRNKPKISRQTRKKLSLIDAEDSATAVLEHSKIGAHQNKRNIDLLFADYSNKKNSRSYADDETQENSSVDNSDIKPNEINKVSDTITVGGVNNDLKPTSFKRLKLF